MQSTRILSRHRFRSGYTRDVVAWGISECQITYLAGLIMEARKRETGSIDSGGISEGGSRDLRIRTGDLWNSQVFHLNSLFSLST